MFMLTAVEDSVRVDPSQLGGPASIAVEEEIKQLYFDKVIANVGLVVSLYDISSIEGGDVEVGDGGVRFTAKFRLVVFRPFEGELLLGVITKSSEHGVTVSLGFTEDVFIPERYMQSPGSMYDATKGTWFWKFEADVLWMDAKEKIRFKATHPGPEEGSTHSKRRYLVRIGEDGAPDAPMLLIGDIDGDGLGCMSWWDNKEDDDDGEAMQE